MGLSIILTSILEWNELLEYKVNKMEKAYSSRLDIMDERLGVLKESCSSINPLVRTIENATESSSAPITQVAQNKVNISPINVIDRLL